MEKMNQSNYIPSKSKQQQYIEVSIPIDIQVILCNQGGSIVIRGTGKIEDLLIGIVFIICIISIYTLFTYIYVYIFNNIIINTVSPFFYIIYKVLIYFRILKFIKRKLPTITIL